MSRRHVTTGVTLVALLVLIAVGGAYGAKALFAPIPSIGSSASNTCDPTSLAKGQRIRARQVQVSVFNAGTRSGLADSTLNRLSKRGFRAGDTGNAPADAKVTTAQVWTTESGDLAARLVARQFGRSTKVRVVQDALGPGVDVVVGNKLRKLAKPTKVLVVSRASSACLPSPSASPTAS